MINFEGNILLDSEEISINSRIMPALTNDKFHPHIMEVSASEKIGQIVVKFIKISPRIFGVGI